MPTIKELKQQIAKEKSKQKAIKTKLDLEVEKRGLQLELKKLQRKPSTSRNILLAKRTGRGLKILSKKAFEVTKRQVKRIKEQQLRDEARIRAFEKKDKKLNKGKKPRKKSLAEQVGVSGFEGLGF